MLCRNLHLANVGAFLFFQRHIEETLLLVQSSHLRHLPIGQFKVENFDILLDVIGIRGSGNGRKSFLHVPAENNLCR